MNSWLGAFISIMCLWNHACTQEIANGRVECYAGSIRCDTGYLYTKEDPTFRCGSSELGQCNRYLWNKPEDIEVMQGHFPVPKIPKAGWIASVTGIPQKFTRITIELVSEGEELVVSHFDIRMSGNHGPMFDKSVVINEAGLREDGGYKWAHQETYHPMPYPFVIGKEFTVKFIATSDNSLTYYINGKQLAYRILQTPIHEVAKVTVEGDVSISQVNVWCQDH